MTRHPPPATRHRPVLMGILNTTPDSFSDGGRFLKPDAAVRRGLQMEREGAAIIDIGAESTRPGSKAVSPKEQLRRLLPVLRGIRKRSKITISIDTQSALVASACLEEGADIINDVSALQQDRRMLKLLARCACPVIIMHMLGTPRTMQKDPRYKEVVRDILAFFRERLRACGEAGISSSRVIVDPGIGFGKTLEHNLEILRRLDEFQALKRPIMIGVSRKSFLGRITGEDNPSGRVTASVAAGLAAVSKGASILRVHDVKEHADALGIWAALNSAKQEPSTVL
ncbi:MAG TPA: dihydropteroate synthase [Planctomycetota bacterium]|nr:dihydropteroate synthase [Planctomycetota bacterium]